MVGAIAFGGILEIEFRILYVLCVWIFTTERLGLIRVVFLIDDAIAPIQITLFQVFVGELGLELTLDSVDILEFSLFVDILVEQGVVYP